MRNKDNELQEMSNIDETILDSEIGRCIVDGLGKSTEKNVSSSFIIAQVHILSLSSAAVYQYH